MPFCSKTNARGFSDYSRCDDGYVQASTLLELASPIYGNKRIFLALTGV